MKTNIFLAAFFMLGVHFAIAQGRPYNVVFDITSKDTVDHKSVIRWLTEITQSNPNAKLEVVFYGQSLDMITKGKSIVADAVMKFAKYPNVAFKVCQIAMKNNKVEMSDLLPGVGTVPDGIYEVISKEGEGWGYIKAAR